jgi:hypothetical protein
VFAQSPPRFRTLLGGGCARAYRRLGAKGIGGLDIELPRNRQPLPHLITGQGCGEIGAVGAVDLAKIKPIVAEFCLHLAYVVIGADGRGEGKADCNSKKGNTIVHTLLIRTPRQTCSSKLSSLLYSLIHPSYLLLAEKCRSSFLRCWFSFFSPLPA